MLLPLTLLDSNPRHPLVQEHADRLMYVITIYVTPRSLPSINARALGTLSCSFGYFDSRVHSVRSILLKIKGYIIPRTVLPINSWGMPIVTPG